MPELTFETLPYEARRLQVDELTDEPWRWAVIDNTTPAVLCTCRYAAQARLIAASLVMAGLWRLRHHR